MGNCALVIGIDAYKNTEWNLHSAVSDALAFAAWAITQGGVEPKDMILLLSPLNPGPGNTLALPDNAGSISFAPADSDTIVKAVNRLTQLTAPRAFVYFAGHGCSAPGSGDDESPQPVLFPSDIADLATDYKRILGAADLRHPLLKSGPNEQFFFFDACRDFFLEDHERA